MRNVEEGRRKWRKRREEKVEEEEIGEKDEKEGRLGGCLEG